MIRRLRWKIVAINMAMVTAVLLAVFVGVLVSSRAAVERTVNQRLMQVVQTGRYDASLPGEGSAAPCFVADVYPSGTVRLSGSSYYRLDDQDAMAEIVTACLEQGDSSGILRSYHLRYLRADGPLYTRIAFTDAAQEDATLRAVVKMCLIVGVAALAVLLGCSYLLAGLAARPVARSLDQQRRFLSDASHELKTPLTVILSSADLMQQTAVQPDQQPYVDNIRWSGRRMKRLVEDMLTLSRADDGRLKAAMVPVDLSDAVVDTALRFEPVAFEAGRQLSYDIDEGITVTGSRDQLQQVAGVLLDNAIKYAPQGAQVRMTLIQAERKAVLTVENGGGAASSVRPVLPGGRQPHPGGLRPGAVHRPGHRPGAQGNHPLRKRRPLHPFYRDPACGREEIIAQKKGSSCLILSSGAEPSMTAPAAPASRRTWRCPAAESPPWSRCPPPGPPGSSTPGANG